MEKTTSPKKTGKRFANADHKYLGTEPEWNSTQLVSDPSQDRLALIQALNWYNHFSNATESRKFLLAYLKSKPFYSKKEVAAIETLGLDEMPIQAGFVARMFSKEAPLDSKTLNWFQGAIKDGVILGLPRLKPAKKTSVKSAEISVADRVAARASNLIGLVEHEIDVFIGSKFVSEFSLAALCGSRNTAPMIARKVADHFANGLLAELEEAKKGNDADLKEGYSHFKKSQLVKLIDFVSKIVADANAWAGIQKAMKKPKKVKPGQKQKAKKEVPIEKLVAKAKIQKASKEFGLTSVAVEKIVGATTVWTFNTKYKALAVYHAKENGTLTIKGSTIKGFDESTTKEKRVRKPTEVLPEVLSGGKVTLRNLMASLKTKEVLPKGRLNENIIIVRVIK